MAELNTAVNYTYLHIYFHIDAFFVRTAKKAERKRQDTLPFRLKLEEFCMVSEWRKLTLRFCIARAEKC